MEETLGKHIIKKWGNSLVIVLSAEDIRINRLSIGDIIDLEFTRYINQLGEKKK